MKHITRLCVGGPLSGQFIESQEDREFDVAVEGGVVLRYEPRTFRVDSNRSGLSNYHIFVTGKELSTDEVVAVLSKAHPTDGLIAYLKNARV